MAVSGSIRGDSLNVPERPHGCYQGVVYIGHLADDPESGEAEPVEVLEAVGCRRCQLRSAGDVGDVGDE